MKPNNSKGHTNRILQLRCRPVFSVAMRCKLSYANRRGVPVRLDIHHLKSLSVAVRCETIAITANRCDASQTEGASRCKADAHKRKPSYEN